MLKGVEKSWKALKRVESYRPTVSAPVNSWIHIVNTLSNNTPSITLATVSSLAINTCYQPSLSILAINTVHLHNQPAKSYLITRRTKSRVLDLSADVVWVWFVIDSSRLSIASCNFSHSMCQCTSVQSLAGRASPAPNLLTSLLIRGSRLSKYGVPGAQYPTRQVYSYYQYHCECAK